MANQRWTHVTGGTYTGHPDFGTVAQPQMFNRPKPKRTRSADRIRQKIRDEVVALKDKELVDTAWAEFDDWEADSQVKQDVETDLKEAEEQLRDHVLLTDEGRRRLRRFLRNKLWQDRRPARKEQ